MESLQIKNVEWAFPGCASRAGWHDSGGRRAWLSVQEQVCRSWVVVNAARTWLSGVLRQSEVLHASAAREWEDPKVREEARGLMEGRHFQKVNECKLGVTGIESHLGIWRDSGLCVQAGDAAVLGREREAHACVRELWHLWLFSHALVPLLFH